MKFFISTIAVIFSASLHAQTTDSLRTSTINEVTIVGSNANKLVGSGAVLDAKKIQKLNQLDVNKALGNLPGINIRDEEGFGLRPNIGLRGTPVNRSAKITIMEDGVLTAPAPYTDPSAYYFPTFARMEGVEVLKGSSQIKYGPATIGGCLNLISTSVPTSPKAFAQASIGSFGTSQLRAFAGSRINNISFVVEANRLASAGFKQLPNNGNTGFDRRDAMAKIKWESNANARVQQSISMKLLAMQELGNESYLGLTYEDFVANPYQRYAATQLDKLTMNHRTATLNHTIKLSKNVNISTTAYYARTFRDWARVQTIGGVSLNNILQNPTANDTAYSIMTGKIDGALTYQTAARTYHSKGLQTTLQGKWNIGNFVHKVELGLRLHADEADRYATLSNYEMKAQRMTEVLQGMNGNAENQLRNASALAGYVHYELKNRNLKITPGIRIEKINFDLDNYGNNDYERQGTALKQGTNNLLVVLPGIGVHYSLCKYGGIFGGIHQGFSPPGMPNVSTGATQAKPEMAVNFELGYRFTNDYFKTQIVGFYNDYNNILGTDNVSGGGAGTGELFNAGNAKISGVECSVEYDLMQLINKKSNIKLPLAAAYTLTNARFSDTFVNAGGDWGTGLIQSGDNIPFITPQLFAATLGIEINNFDATLSGRYTGQTRTKPGQGEVLVPNTSNAYKNVNTIDSYFVMDLSANYRFHNNVAAFVSINNLLNKQYIVANLPQGYRPGMPLAATVGIKVFL